MNVLTRAGQIADVEGNITSNNNNEITALITRTVLGNIIDSARFRKNDLPIPGGTTSGTGNAYTLSIADDYPAAYTANFCLLIYTDKANTGDATLNVNSLGAKDWKRADGTNFAGGEILINQFHLVSYNGTEFRTIFREGNSLLGVVNTTSTTLTLATDTIYNYGGSADATFTLPAGSAGIIGKLIKVYNDTSFVITISPNGGDTISSFFGGDVYGGDKYTFTWTGTKWILT